MTMSDKTYDFLKWVAQIALPALGVFVAAIIALYGLPYGEQIVGTISAVDVLLGKLLETSSKNYEGDGTIVIDESNPDKDIYSIVMDDYPETLAGKTQVMLKVVQAVDSME